MKIMYLVVRMKSCIFKVNFLVYKLCYFGSWRNFIIFEKFLMLFGCVLLFIFYLCVLYYKLIYECYWNCLLFVLFVYVEVYLFWCFYLMVIRMIMLLIIWLLGVFICIVVWVNWISYGFVFCMVIVSM